MISDKSFCKNQILRFEQLGGYPSGKEAVGELVTALQCFDTQAEAIAFVDDWLKRYEACPKPSEIRRAAWQLEEQQEQAKRKSKYTQCNYCGDSVWRMVQRTMEVPGVRTSTGAITYDFAERCDHKPRHEAVANAS